MVPIAPLAKSRVPTTWVGTSTSITVPLFGSLVIKRCGKVARVDPDTWLMAKVELVDANGKETTYVVEGIRINSGLADEQFRFRIPDGVDVVDLR